MPVTDATELRVSFPAAVDFPDDSYLCVKLADQVAFKPVKLLDRCEVSAKSDAELVLSYQATQSDLQTFKPAISREEIFNFV